MRARLLNKRAFGCAGLSGRVLFCDSAGVHLFSLPVRDIQPVARSVIPSTKHPLPGCEAADVGKDRVRGEGWAMGVWVLFSPKSRGRHGRKIRLRGLIAMQAPLRGSVFDPRRCRLRPVQTLPGRRILAGGNHHGKILVLPTSAGKWRARSHRSSPPCRIFGTRRSGMCFGHPRPPSRANVGRNAERKTFFSRGKARLPPNSRKP